MSSQQFVCLPGLFRRSTWVAGALLSVLVPAQPAQSYDSEASQVPLEEIVVTASLRQQTLDEMPSSITVLQARTLEAAGLQHFEDVLGLVPNLNWSGGTSRP